MRLLLCVLFAASAAAADVVVPTRTLRANTVISHDDVKLVAGDVANVFDRLEDVIGQEARVALYAGRPIRFDSLGPPALIDRNQIVSIRFQGAGLVITTDGRSLERGGVGDRVRVMNLSSRTTVFGFVQSDGSIEVRP